MSQYFGDLASSADLNFKFTTVGTDGAPTQLAGSPQLQIYKSNSTTQTTTGLTLTADFDSVTGLNHVLVNTASSGAFYSTGTDYTVIVSSGTVGGTSIAGYEVGHFSIRNRSVNVAQWNGSAVATPTQAGVPEVDVTHWLGTAAATPSVAGVPEVDVTHFGGTAATASGGRPEVNTSHIAGTAQTANDVGQDVNDILADTADMQPKFGTFTDLGGGANIANNLNDLAGTTFSSTTDSNEAIRNHIGDGTNLTEAGGTGDQLSAIPWNAAWDAEVQSEVEDGITAQEPLSANVTQISGDSTAADRLEALMDGVLVVQINGTATATSFPIDGFTSVRNDQFNGRLLTIINDNGGSPTYEQTDITDYDHATQTLTVTAVTSAPADDTFLIIH